MYARAYNNNTKQRDHIQSIITGLMHDIKQLAPHPDKPGYRGPLFIKSSPNARIASEHDGMLGTMMMEAMIGGAFSQAVSNTFGDWTQEIDLANTLECYSEYITDIEDKKSNDQDEQHIREHGQGTLARLSEKKIANSFNMRSSIDEAMQSFLDDLPKRLEKEKNLAYYLRQLEMMDAPAPAMVAAPAAPTMSGMAA